MVIKKPYAFLIKHFRLVHGLLFGLLVFLMVQSLNIYSFFNQYLKTHIYYNQNGMAQIYANIPVFIGIILAIAISFVIYYILTIKNKPNKFYLFVMLYNVLLLAYFIYMYFVFVGLESKAMDVETVRIFRDISLLVVMPQLILIAITFGRTLGFNIKQFDFRKDLEELDINIEDSEEVEVTFGLDTYKIFRNIRKVLRLVKYFLLENKLFVITMTSALVLGLSIYMFIGLSKYQSSYEQAQNLDVSSLTFNVKNSYITNVDLSNNVINKDKYYILVDTYIKNKYNTNYSLTRETFGLQIGKKMLTPNYSVNEKFKDIGQIFYPCDLSSEEEKEFIIIFEIDSSEIAKDYMFKIKNNNSTSLVENYYKNVIIKPIDLNNNKDEGSFKIPTEIKLNNSILGNSSIKIEEYQVASSFKEKHKYTINGVETEGIYSIIPTTKDKGSAAILKIKANLNKDDSTYFSKYINKPSDFFDYYGLLEYRYMGEYKKSKMTKINVNYETENYSYLEVPGELMYANKIDMIILIRGVKYTINLK